MKKPSSPAPLSRSPSPTALSTDTLAHVVGGNSSVVGTSRTLDPSIRLAGTQIGNPGSSGLTELDLLAHWGVGNG